MKALGKTVGVNTTPCRAYGHTMRTRAGHCLRCRPENYGYLKQYISGGYVYIAESSSTRLLKIGLTGNLPNREYYLNYHQYADLADWNIRDYLYVPERAGEEENRVHKTLKPFSTFRTYDFGGETVYCKEVFDCPLETAREALHRFNAPLNQRPKLRDETIH